jgi:hypothetical protein
MTKSNLPIEVHDNFRKTNVLHKYVQDSLREATKHALEAGQELLAAKAAIPHGSWENECERLFDGSLRTAQFYMQFARDMGTLKSAEANAVLFLESGLEGAAKAARKAAAASGGKQPQKRTTSPKPEDDVVDVDVMEDEFEDTEDPFSEGEGEDGRKDPDGTDAQESTPEPPRNGKDKPGDYGKCPNCLEPAGDDDFPEDETLEDICERETSEIESWARKISSLMADAQTAMSDIPTLDELNARVGWERKLKEALATLRGAKPVPCPICGGDGGKKCPCKGHGRVTKQQYGQMV